MYHTLCAITGTAYWEVVYLSVWWIVQARIFAGLTNRLRFLDNSIIAITGIYLHLIRFDDLYTPGYLGWYKVHPSVFVDPHGEEYELLFDQCQMWNYRTGHEDMQAAQAYIQMCEQEAQEDEQRRKELEETFGNTEPPQRAVFARGRFVMSE